MLGSQPLSALRDVIRCVTDTNAAAAAAAAQPAASSGGDARPLPATLAPPKGAYFYIEGEARHLCTQAAC